MENLDLIPSNVNLSGAEIELIGVDDKEYILKVITDKIIRKYDLYYYGLSAIFKYATIKMFKYSYIGSLLIYSVNIMLWRVYLSDTYN